MLLPFESLLVQSMNNVETSYFDTVDLQEDGLGSSFQFLLMYARTTLEPLQRFADITTSNCFK